MSIKVVRTHPKATLHSVQQGELTIVCTHLYVEKKLENEGGGG